MNEKIKIFKKEFFVTLGYILVSIYATFPVILKLNSAFYGTATDPLAWMWNFWWMKYSNLKGLDLVFCNMLAYPFGLKIPALFPAWGPINKCLAMLTGEVAAYNLQIITSFFLAGVAMYMLVFYFTKNRLASFFSGVVFMLCPYHFARSWDHLGLSNMHWMVFYIRSLFIVIKEKTYKSAIICGLCLGLISHLSNLYYLYFMLIFSSIFIIYWLGYGLIINKKVQIKDCFKTIKVAIIAVIIALIMILPHINVIKKSLALSSEVEFNVKDVSRPFGQLFADSARPLNYFLPTEYHPILGKITKIFINTPLYGENSGGEQSLYLGIIPLMLAFFGYRQWQNKKKALKTTPMEDFVSSFFSIAFFVFMIFSFSPYWGIKNGVLIPFPSYFLYEIFPMFRNYARMGVLVMVCVCVLAGFGLKYYLEKISAQRKKLAVVSILCCIVLLEFLNFPPFRTTDVSDVSPAYLWLKDQPDDIVIAEYPIDADGRQYLFNQRVHHKSMINGAVPGTYAYEVMEKIVDVNAEKTAGILGFLGAKYLVMHEDKYTNYDGGVILGQIPDLSSNTGYVLVKDFGNKKIYEITAKVVDPKAVTENNNGKQMNLAGTSPALLEVNNFGFKVGDKFFYTIKYFGIIPLFDFYLEVKDAPSDNNLLLEAEAKEKGIIAKFMDIDIKLKSLIDKDATIPLRYKQSIRMGKENKVRDVVFNHEQLFVISGERRVSINKNTQDPLSALFYLAAFDFNEGRKIDVFINPGKTNYKLQAEVLGETQIKYSGKKISCWEVQGEYFSLKGKSKKIASVNIWFLNDRAKTLVRMQVLTKLGFITIEKNTAN
ncbi:MAG: DUF3108 domain-containing protein [Candidatus Omnitrophota bacterium]